MLKNEALFLVSLVLFLSMNVFVLSQQNKKNFSLTGEWRGYILVLDENQEKISTVNLEMKLKQIDANRVIGTSFDFVHEKKTYCIGNLEGRIAENKITLETKSIEVQKKHIDYTHVLLIYDLVLTKENLLEGTAFLSNQNKLYFDTEAKPIKIFLARYADTYEDDNKYRYSMSIPKSIAAYNKTDNKIDEYLKPDEKIVANKLEHQKEKKNKSLSQISNKFDFNEAPFIKPDSNASFTAKNQSTATYIRNNDDSIEEKKFAKHTNIKLSDKAEEPIKVIALNEERIATFQNALEKNKNLKTINDYCLSKPIKQNAHIFEFSNPVILFTINGNKKSDDSVALFFNKKLVEPFLHLQGTKQNVYKVDFQNEEFLNLTLSNISSRKENIMMNIRLYDNLNNTIYEIKLNNSFGENARLTLYHNPEEPQKNPKKIP